MKKPFKKLIGICWLSIFLFLISTTGAFAQYCSSASTNTSDEWLSNVSFAGIDNASGSTTYSDFTDISGTVIPGVDYEFSATISQIATYTETVTVYIDWNQDLIFDAELERYDIGTCSSDGCVVTSDISVPATATPGETRMRVVEKYFSASTDPCETFTYGEVEDYSIIVESGECTPPDFDFVVTNDCVNDTYTVTATLNDFGTSNFITIYLTRSDEVAVNNVTLPFALEGQTVNIIVNVPFGVTVEASIEGSNPICNLSRTWEELICPAENDEICDAVSLTCGDTLVDMPFVGATESIDDDCVGTGIEDVWYTFTSDGSVKYIFSEISSANVIMSVYTGTSCNDTSLFLACTSFPEDITITEAGTYFVRVRPFTEGEILHSVSIECIPFDCPAVLGDVGSPCDDGNPNTYVDVLTESCGCAGFVPVPGQICEVPLDITTLPFSDNGNTEDYFDDYGYSGDNFPPLSPDVIVGENSTTNPYFYMGGDDVVYTYTSSGVESLNLTVSNNGAWTGLFVFTGCPFALTVAYATASSASTLNIEGLITEPGQTYYIVISTFAAPQSTIYTLNVESVEFDCPTLMVNIGTPCDDGDPSTTSDAYTADCECEGIPIPANDEPCNAISLTCNNTLEDLTLLGATPSILDGCFMPENGDIWFSFTTEIGTSYTLDIAGDGPNSTALTSALFWGDCDSLISLLPCNTFSIGYIFGEADTVATFYMRVRAYSDAQSVDVTLQCATPPENADCSTAIPISCFETYTGSTLGSPVFDPNLSFCGVSPFLVPDATNGGAWYTYTPSDTMIVTFDLSGSSYTSEVFLYSNTCDSLICIDGNYSGSEDGNGLLEATLNPGQTYYILVTGFGNNRGAFTLNVTCVNPACSPTIESITAVTQNGDSLACIPLESDYYLEVSISGGSDSGYNLSANDGASVSIAPNGSAILGPLSEDSPVEITVTGVTNQACTATQAYELPYCPPADDEACGATPLVCGDVLSVDFQGATGSVEVDCMGSSDNDVWVKFVADGTQNFRIEEDSPFDAVIRLFQGDDCGNLTAVGNCVDFNEFFQVSQAGTYYMAIRPYFVDNEDESATVTLTCLPFTCLELGGNFGDPCDDGDPNTVNDQITVDCECVGEPQIANDEACDAITIACGDTIAQIFEGASTSIDDDCFNDNLGDVWFKFIADGTQVYNIAEIGGPPDFFFAVNQLFEGDDCGNLTEVQGCSTAPSFDVFDAGTYYFRVRPYSEFYEDFTAHIVLTCSPYDCPELSTNIGAPCDDGNPNTVGDVVDGNCECTGLPVATNDEPCTATAIACGDTILQSTSGATQTLDPITCEGFTAQQAMDVWFSFEADGVSGYIVKDIDGDDLVLEVFSSDGCQSLTASIGCGDIPETIDLGVLPAGTYFVRAYAYSDNEPYYVVELTLECISNSTASLGGSVTWNSSCGERDAVVSLYEPGTATLVATYNTTIAADGTFSIDDVEIGTFDVIVDVAGYLATGIEDVVIAVGENSLSIGAIVNGDINGDNTVNLFDLSLANASYGDALGDANYNPLADLNCDGFVNLFDLSLANASYGQTSVSAPL